MGKCKFTIFCHFTVLWSVTLKIGALTKLGLLVRFIDVFDQTLAEQLYRGKGLSECANMNLTGLVYTN